MATGPELPGKVCQVAEPIAVQATFSKATTLVDGGWRISFDLSETQAEAVSKIAQLNGQCLYLAIVTEEAYLNAK